MSEEFGPTFTSLTDEDGNVFELEHVDTLEINGTIYMAFYPALPADSEDDEIDDEDYGLILLKKVRHNGEDMLFTIDDEEEETMVYEQFMEILFDEDEEEED